MTREIERGVAQMFREAVAQNAVLELRTDTDWNRFKTIQHTAQTQKAAEINNFERDHPALLAAARKALIDQAGSLQHRHPGPFGVDRFSKEAIDRATHRQVEHAHQARLMQIEAQEADGYSALSQDIRAREGVRDHARDSFARSAAQPEPVPQRSR